MSYSLSFAPYLGQETFSFYIAATLERVEIEEKQVFVREAAIKTYICQEGNAVPSWQEVKKGQLAKEKLINSLFERKNQLKSKPKTPKNISEIKEIENQISSLMRQ